MAKSYRPGSDERVLLLRAERRIMFLRGRKVLLDADLAELYRVSTTRLNEQVRRNLRRFPADFMFQLSEEEFAALISQSAISKPGRGGRRHRPLAFTEQGVAMLSSVLRSERAVLVNVAIMRAFVQLREMLGSHGALARKVKELEERYDSQFKLVFDAIRALVTAKESSGRRIGFDTEAVRSGSPRSRDSVRTAERSCRPWPARTL
jgi:hypothetical protein